MWIVAKTKPNQEFRAKENLKNQGFTSYLPKMNKRKYLRSVWMEFSEIMFPGYIFIKSNVDIHKINYTYGISKLLTDKSTGIPYVIEDSLIAAISKNQNTCKIPKIGDKVEYVKGNTGIIKGVLTSICSRTRVKLLLDFISKKQEVIVPKSDIQKII